MRKIALSFSVFAALLGSTTLAGAQTAPTTRPGYAASSFDPSERGSDWFANDSLDFRGHGHFTIGVLGDYAYRTLIGNYNPDGHTRASIVRNQLFLHAGGSVVFWDRLRLGLSLPIAAYEKGHTGFEPGLLYPAPKNPAVGDLRLSADVRLTGKYGDPFTMGVGASVYLPTGSREAYTGNEVTRLGGHAAIAGDVSIFTYAAKLGYTFSDLNEHYLDTRLGSEIVWAGAAGLRFLDKKLLVGPEVFGNTVTNGYAFAPRATPVEWQLGAHFKIADQLMINAGGGTFLAKGYGAPVWRTLLGIEWAPPLPKEVPDRDKDSIPDQDDGCPDEAGPSNSNPTLNGCPVREQGPTDRDGDGVEDGKDACPDTRGVPSNDPSTNGCPPDRDNDGVVDSEDACPDVRGVKTGDPKTNGCPADRDRDGVLDSDDACPDTAGVRTSDPKTNGCPLDTDRDKDGVPNDVDACPDQPGPTSPDPKKNGCPKVIVGGDTITIMEQPKFDTGRANIKPESNAILDEVAKVLKDHPEIKLVKVEGHTDNVGNAAANKKLSKDRADAVVTWLSMHGIDKGRLTSEGIGQDRPIGSNNTDDGRAQNRRVEFHIIKQDKQ